MDLDKLRKAIKHIDEARAIFESGPLDYYLEELALHSEALRTKFTPIKAGEKAVVVKEVPCTGGWRRCTRTLGVGAAGTIKAVEYDKDGFIFEWVPDQEWWHDDDAGKWRRSESRHSYALREKYLQKWTEPPDGPTETS